MKNDKKAAYQMFLAAIADLDMTGEIKQAFDDYVSACEVPNRIQTNLTTLYYDKIYKETKNHIAAYKAANHFKEGMKAILGL